MVIVRVGKHRAAIEALKEWARECHDANDIVEHKKACDALDMLFGDSIADHAELYEFYKSFLYHKECSPVLN